ncbi:MAG: PHP-associated domain-containing protein [Candidatus Zhuqueibacterota bacterium]
MVMKLKVDLHLHTNRDLAEIVSGRKNLISPTRLIDMAVEQKYDAISITHHGVQFIDKALVEYARRKGLLIIPGVETFIQRKHVLLINFSSKKYILSYEDLLKYKTDDVLVIAPHPNYLVSECLGRDLTDHIECFDGVEFCHYYMKWLNPNRKAMRIAEKFNLPMIGNSDAHKEYQFGTTYSYVYAEEKSIPAIIHAIKQGKVEVVTRPLNLREFTRETMWLLEKMPYIVQSLLKKIAIRTSWQFAIRKYATPDNLKPVLKANRIQPEESAVPGTETLAPVSLSMETIEQN